MPTFRVTNPPENQRASAVQAPQQPMPVPSQQNPETNFEEQIRRGEIERKRTIRMVLATEKLFQKGILVEVGR